MRKFALDQMILLLPIILFSFFGGVEAAIRAEPLPLRNLAKGGVSGIVEARQIVVTNATEWRKLWQAHRANIRNETKPPPVDFAKEMVVCVTLGRQRTGGYAAEILRVEPGEDRLKIFVKRKLPPKGAMVTQALTAPFHFVVVARSDLPAEFFDTVDP